MKIEDIHVDFAKRLLGDDPTGELGLALMVVLHTRHIWLTGEILEDRPGCSQLAAITQRHAAEVIATAWPDRGNEMRTDDRYWYDELIILARNDLYNELPPRMKSRVEQCVAALARLPEVKVVELEP